VLALWARVRPKLQAAAESLPLHAAARLAPAELQALDEILLTTVPELRRLTSARAPPPPPPPPPKAAAAATAPRPAGA
jgi:hypothetical protein